MTPEQAAELRKPFPASVIGKLPKPKFRDAQKGECRECGGYHGLPAVHLDYVGHAAVTDRLLSVDPEWSWEPFAIDANTGLPATQSGNLWIRLTICGVTRIGVGDGSSIKEAIGDAIRNAAMRFGVALDLWAKENLHEFADAVRERQAPPAQQQPAPAIGPGDQTDDRPMTDATRRHLFKMFSRKGIPEDEQLAGINYICKTTYDSRSKVTEQHGQQVIAVLETRPDVEQIVTGDAQ